MSHERKYRLAAFFWLVEVDDDCCYAWAAGNPVEMRDVEVLLLPFFSRGVVVLDLQLQILMKC